MPMASGPRDRSIDAARRQRVASERPGGGQARPRSTDQRTDQDGEEERPEVQRADRPSQAQADKQGHADGYGGDVVPLSRWSMGIHSRVAPSPQSVFSKNRRRIELLGSSDQTRIPLADQFVHLRLPFLEGSGDDVDQPEFGPDQAVAGLLVAAGDPRGQFDLLVAEGPRPPRGRRARSGRRVGSGSFARRGRDHGAKLRGCGGEHAGGAGLKARGGLEMQIRSSLTSSTSVGFALHHSHHRPRCRRSSGYYTHPRVHLRHPGLLSGVDYSVRILLCKAVKFFLGQFGGDRPHVLERLPPKKVDFIVTLLSMARTE